MTSDGPELAEVAVIGAGPAGLACASVLQEAGVTPVIFEKSRGVGGRLATRRHGAVQFDHGAPKVEAKTDAARDWLAAAATAGKAQRSDVVDGCESFVGLPGMSGLCRPLTEGLDIRFSCEVAGAVRHGDLWHLDTSDGQAQARVLAVAIPAPQVLRLLGDLDAVRVPVQEVVMAPCWTMMVQFAASFEPSANLSGPGSPFAQAIFDSGKPGRATAHCWVFHATPDWSRAHLECDKDEALDLLLASLEREEGALPPVTLAMAHRWRFAQTERALGNDFLALPDGGLFIGGDWTRGALAEDGYLSGQAMGRAILK